MKRIIIFSILLAVSISLKAQSKKHEAISEVYHFKIENRAQLIERLQTEEKERSALLLQQLIAYNKSLKPQNRVGDGIKLEVQPNVVLQKAPDGSDELNLELEFSYETVSSEEVRFTVTKNTDDYPAGAYLPTQSKACKMTLAFIKNKVDNDLAEFFARGTNVTITITGVTDGTPIRKVIPYKGEYGDVENRMIYLNDDIDEITVTKKEGITNNSQLAFLRTQGVQQYLETYVDNLHKTNNRYQIYAVEHQEKGSQYRRIAVKFTIHKAFNNQLAQNVIPKETTPKNSDVDENIPSTDPMNKDTYVVIVANEKYNDIVGIVPFAHNDGEIFMEYCIRTLGVPVRQIHFVKDATKNQFDDAVDWLTGIAKVTNSNAHFIFYFAGHGVPNGEDSYLLPVDANPEKAQQMSSLKTLYTILSEMPCKSAICLLDACFSGTRRNGEALLQGGRGIALARPKIPIYGNLIVMSAADARQTAYPYVDQKHGLFTYFLLKGLQESKGEVTLSDLFSEIRKNVDHEAALTHHEQTPCLQVSRELGDSWQNWKLK